MREVAPIVGPADECPACQFGTKASVSELPVLCLNEEPAICTKASFIKPELFLFWHLRRIENRRLKRRGRLQDRWPPRLRHQPAGWRILRSHRQPVSSRHPRCPTRL